MALDFGGRVEVVVPFSELFGVALAKHGEGADGGENVVPEAVLGAAVVGVGGGDDGDAQLAALGDERVRERKELAEAGVAAAVFGNLLNKSGICKYYVVAQEAPRLSVFAFS